MEYVIDKRAVTQWGKSSISFVNYQNYISLKADQFELGLIDLLYISNFKGGNATINEPEYLINEKLICYSNILRSINKEYSTFTLADLDIDKLDRLSLKVEEICSLTTVGSEQKIDGFSVSYLSALLNAYFPYLIPILDRRLLINLGLVTAVDVDKQGQIKSLPKFYRPLMNRMRELSISSGKNIREIDKEIFSRKLFFS
ncbi:hypothetical protein [Sphingobacterium deserti]|uniref:Uncharacterized protein n=1 Tax=Sphingobacterium deserti TaxID=1229276 RepID=A0A0B8T1A8_9SPHI|nr:hypothetical protein [Sphingobacterium deserti]KGE14627.1 hypothetical protein DI53_1656 [Sphingobacterium deserti]